MNCEHVNCHCQSEVGISDGGREYCSTYCRDAGRDQSTECRCGHAGCSTDEARSAEAGAIG